MTLTASTGLIVLLGDRVRHSVSPAIHNAGFAACGLDLAYLACAVPGDRFADALAGLHALGARGANVTVPHKEVAFELAETLGPTARATGAVNTLVRTETGWSGHNTDLDGFAAPLRDLGVPLGGGRAVVLGAGGAARAATRALGQDFGLARVDVAARRPGQAERVVADLAPDAGTELRAVALGDADLSGAALIVNATPLGMEDADASPCGPEAFREGQVAYDLVYGPRPTRFVRDAERAGATALGGLAMLVGQAAGAFHLWTGRHLPVAVATTAARRALTDRHV